MDKNQRNPQVSIVLEEKTLYSMMEKAKKYDELLKLNRTPLLNCSFCGKNQEQVERLIAGPSVFICNECVTVCMEILEEERNKTEESDKEKDKGESNEEVLEK